MIYTWYLRERERERKKKNLNFMTFITTYVMLNLKSHIVWGLLYFETTSNFSIPSIKVQIKSPISGCILFLIHGEC